MNRSRRHRRQKSVTSPEQLELRLLLSARTGADFNGDGFDDLVIGLPYETLAGFTEAGVVHIIYGTSNGLHHDGNQFWHQNRPGVHNTIETGDRFGESVAAGDFGGGRL